MTKDEALKLALEALELSHPRFGIGTAIYIKATAAIKEALAQPEQEPVTWRYKIVDVFGRPAWTLKTPKSDTRVLESQPLYTTPPQRKPLTMEQLTDLFHADGADPFEFARAIEAAHGIKENT